MEAALVLGFAAAALMLGIVSASDPEVTTDFSVPWPWNRTTIDARYFTSTDFRAGVGAMPGAFGVKKLFEDKLPVLSGLGVGLALLEFNEGSINPPHTHPRGTELLFVITGALDVALIDSTNKIFSQTLFAGDVFVFPKGLVHYQFNKSKIRAVALSSFSSSNPGTISLPTNIFNSGIPSDVLAKSFKTSPTVINQITSALH